VKLTDDQEAVAQAEGNFLLIACPGSGKTRSAAARVGVLTDAGQRVAICSYTNVGADRIGTVIQEMGITLGPENFLGTLHSVLLRYVVYPFGHLFHAERQVSVMVDRSSRTVAYKKDPKKPISVDAFRMRPDRSLVLTKRPRYLSSISAEEIVANVEQEVRDKKLSLLRSGRVSFDDAMYVALRVLEENPEIAKAVAGRFDELLLDEAQDTSELQLACLHVLKATGRLRSLVLVGDLEQSIFRFQGASAKGCSNLAENHGLRIVPLTQNHRCSQLICDVAAHFCDRPNPDEAVGPHADCPIQPEIVLYPPKEPRIAVERFRERLAIHNGQPSRAAVLCRGNKLVDELNGTELSVEVAARPRHLGEAVAALRHGTLTRRGLERVERIVAYAAWSEERLDALDIDQRKSLREAVVRYLMQLPPLDSDLREWIRESAKLLTSIAKELVTKPAKAGGLVLQSKAKQTGTQARAAFLPEPIELEAQTVHDIKGEDRDAILVVLDRPRSKKYPHQATLWAALASEKMDEAQAEEKRIAFVALTRAERVCIVALPDDTDGREAAAVFIERGFASPA
jgi:superfamily I DNA/RNA helicase